MCGIVSGSGYQHSSNSLKNILSICGSFINQIILINQSTSDIEGFFFFKHRHFVFIIYLLLLFLFGERGILKIFVAVKNLSRIRFQNPSKCAFIWKTNPIRHEVSLWRNCYMWWHWLLKIEMKWEEANTDVYEILLSLNDTKNSIYLIISVMPTGDCALEILHRAASWLLKTQVLSHMSPTSVVKRAFCDCWVLGIVLHSLSWLK